MKRTFCLLCILMTVLCSVNAQTVVAPEGKYGVYCKVYGVSYLQGKGSLAAKVDVGRVESKYDDSEYIVENGKKVRFNSMMDILDYMAKRGWHLHSTYMEQEGSNRGGLIYLMVKFVTDDSQKIEGLELAAE